MGVDSCILEHLSFLHHSDYWKGFLKPQLKTEIATEVAEMFNSFMDFVFPGFCAYAACSNHHS